MNLPSRLTYNDLNGEEIKQVLYERFRQLLEQVPYLQRHLTLPRLAMRLQIDLISYAEQASGEVRTLDDTLVIDNELTLRAKVDASPLGDPPDKVREEHGLAISRPERGDRELGAHYFTHDHEIATAALTQFPPVDSTRVNSPVLEGNIVEGLAGMTFDRTGSGAVKVGSQTVSTIRNSTTVVYDQGPAGLRNGENSRERLFGDPKGRK